MIGITITKDESLFSNSYSIEIDGLGMDKMLELQQLLNQRVFQTPLPQPAAVAEQPAVALPPGGARCKG